MSADEIKFSTQGQKAKKFNREPVPKGEYDGKLDGTSIEVCPPSEPGKLPYVKTAFELLGTGTEGGRNRKVFHNFFLNMDPGADGTSMAQRADGVLGYTNSVGEEPEFSGRMVPYTKKDKKGNVLEKKQVPIVNPQELASWLKSHDGLVSKVYIGIERSKGYEPKNKILEFIESAGGQAAATDAPTFDDTELDASVATALDSDLEPEGDEDEAPPPRKSAPAVAKKAAGKKR